MRSRSPVFGVIFALFFSGMASVFVIVGARGALHQATCLRTYLPVPARILSSDITRIPARKGDLFTANILYSYSVDGTRYVSSTQSALDGYISSPSSQSAAQDLIRAFPASSTTTAYRSPTDPRLAFLIHRLRFLPYAFMLLPMIHFEIGLGVLRFSLRAGSTPRRAARSVLFMAATWDAVGAAAFGHFLACGGSLWWKPLIALVLYGGLGLAITVLAWRTWSALPRAVTDAALADAQNPYRLND